MTWQTRRAKRVAIDRNAIRQRCRRMGAFAEGSRAARDARIEGMFRTCPYKLDSEQAGDWQRGYDFTWEKYNGG